MVAALTTSVWIEVLNELIRRNKKDTAGALACVLRDVIEESNDQTVARVLDRHASRMLEE